MLSMDISIRKLDQNDREILKKFKLYALHSEPLAFGSSYEEKMQHTDDVWKKKLGSNTEHTYWVLNEDWMQWVATWRFVSKQKMKHVAHLSWVFVSEQMRWKWVAKQLIQKILNDVQQEGLMKVQLTVNKKLQTAYHFYKKMWFQEVGKLKWELYYDWKYYDELIMEYYFD